MHRKLFIFFVICILSFTCFAQNTTPVRRTNEQIRIERDSIKADNAFKDLQNLEINSTFQKSPYEIMGQDIQPVYRKPSKKDLKDLLPSENLQAQYIQMLKQPNTGIFKLSADSSCANNIAVVVAKDSCIENKIPGGGTAFSFRTNSHRVLHLADLTLGNDIIKTDSVRQQGIMVNLGNIELDQITSETNGLKFLIEFNPSVNKKEIEKVETELGEGINHNGFIYRFGFYADVNTTFALRSVAYRGTLMRSVKGVAYNEMDYDKRKDIIVVFRIIEKDRNGDITIVWKEIMKKDSPTLKEN